MSRRKKIAFGLFIVIALVYGVTFVFAKDVFEILVPFWEFPRDCGPGC